MSEKPDAEKDFSAACTCSSCDYRSLYEGALVSLSEMASNQRRSVERLGRSRSALVSLLMQNFPFQARAMERSSGRRLADLSEEELVSAISSAIRSRRDDESERAIQILSGHIERSGVVLPEDRSLWEEFLSEPTSPDTDGKEKSAASKESSRAPSAAAPVPLSVQPPAEPDAGTHSSLPPLFPPPKAKGQEPEPQPAPPALEGKGAEEDPPASDEKDDVEAGEGTATKAPDRSEAPKPLRAPATLFQEPLRPGIPEKRQGRRRTQAKQAPTGTARSEAVELDEKTREELLAAVSVPRPVFTSDLVLATGSESLVDAWEAECRASPSSSPVRFIAPKSRHRHRGRLVVPASSEEAPTDWWPRCVALYRAGRLYELAVVLRHFQDDILSVRLADESALVRVRGESGSSALALLLSPLPRESSDDILGPLLTELSQERLDSIILLSASGEKDARATVAAAASKIIAARDLSISAHLVAAVSWEYVEDAKSAAVFVSA